MKWSKFVDIVTAIWLIVFIVSCFSTEIIARICNVFNLFVLPVFIMDLVFVYRASPNSRTFFKKQWLSVLMVIPYVRIFRILRVFRIVKAARGAKIVRLGKRWEIVKSIFKGRRTMKAVKIIKE